MQKSKSQENYASLAEDANKILKAQLVLEDKVGSTFAGRSLNETILGLIMSKEQKLAEKLKNDFKVSEKRWTWLRIQALSKTRSWPELKKLLKSKKLPVSIPTAIRIVKENSSESEARNIVAEEDFIAAQDRITILSDFGLWMEAAQAAFSAPRSLEALNGLEIASGGREDVRRIVKSFKDRLAGTGK